MIPGPVEISPAVRAAAASPPPGHTAPRLIAAFGASLERLREVWGAPAETQPFVVPGAGTLAMDMAAANLVSPGDRVLVVDTGFFSRRMAEILRRQGARVVELGAEPGEVPPPESVERALGSGDPFRALFLTHVDTSTGVRLPIEPLARIARGQGVLTIVDGVCATAGERFAMADWNVDVCFTASQKALGLPPGLALMAVGERALAARRARPTAPPLYLDWDSWLPIMRAYEERRPSYFSTPPTSLVLALECSLEEILRDGIEQRVALHTRAATALRAAWERLDLRLVATRSEIAANTLSALYFPPGVDSSLIPRILEHGVTVASGIHPALQGRYFRVGHLGWVVTRPELLLRTVEAVAMALAAAGHAAEPAAAVEAAAAQLGG